MRQTLVIVPDSLKAAAEAASAVLSPGSVGESFTIPLSASGAAPATHWASQPNVSDAALSQIQGLLATEQFTAAVLVVAQSQSDHLAMIERGLASEGLQKVEAE